MTDPQTPRYYVAQNHVELHRERWDVYRQVGATPSYEQDILVCEARERLDANRIAAALDIVALQPRLAAMNADYLDLFAAYHALKREHGYALSALDAALDVTNARKAVLEAADTLTQHKVQSPEWNVAYIILRRTTVTLAEIERQAP